MSVDEKLNDGMVIEGLRFDNADEFELAKKELDAIRIMERKYPLGNARVALSVYNNAVNKKYFKTVVGYAFLKRLRETIVSCGLVSDEMLNPIPVLAAQDGTTGDNLPGGGISAQDKYRLLYNGEKRKKTVLALIVAALTVVIIAMFFISTKSGYSFATYFTDYENNIRNEVINDYEEWEKELKAREDALGGVMPE